MAVSINGTSGVSGVDGSAGTPALQGSDTNTGISFGTDEVLISTGGAERAKIDASGYLRLASGGIQFNGDTGAVNALNDYEEGTWTATLIGDTTAPTVAVTVQGRYTKIGRAVTVSVTFSGVDTTGASGQMRITGLPFTIANDLQARSYSAALCQNMNITGYAMARGESNTTNAHFFFTSGNTLSSLNISAGLNRYVGFSFTYEAA